MRAVKTAPKGGSAAAKPAFAGSPNPYWANAKPRGESAQADLVAAGHKARFQPPAFLAGHRDAELSEDAGQATIRRWLGKVLDNFPIFEGKDRHFLRQRELFAGGRDRWHPWQSQRTCLRSGNVMLDCRRIAAFR